MAITLPDTSRLSGAEKIALMEHLWEEISITSEIMPPTWHEEILQAREKEWEDRRQVSQDWSDAKEEICKELK